MSPAGPVCASVPVNSPQSPVVSPAESPAGSTNCSADEPQQQNNKRSSGFSRSRWTEYDTSTNILGKPSRSPSSPNVSDGYQFHLCVSSTRDNSTVSSGL